MVNIYFVSQRVACLLRKVVQEIERRISTQAEHLRTVRIILPFFFKKKKLNCFSMIDCTNGNIFMLLSLQQNNLFKVREEKYQSRIRVLEALASGTGEERGV
jgi:kinesin family protein C2/C3